MTGDGDALDVTGELDYLLDLVRAAGALAEYTPAVCALRGGGPPEAPHKELARVVPALAVLSPATRHLVERTLLGAIEVVAAPEAPVLRLADVRP